MPHLIGHCRRELDISSLWLADDAGLGISLFLLTNIGEILEFLHSDWPVRQRSWTILALIGQHLRGLGIFSSCLANAVEIFMCTHFHVPCIFHRALGISSFRLSSDREILQCLYSEWSRSQRLLQFFLPFETHRVADILESLYSD